MTTEAHSNLNIAGSGDNPSLRWTVYLLVTAIVAGLVLGHLWIVEPLQSANDRSRWCTVWSLVERGTYAIDEIVKQPRWQTIDKVLHEGHFYSSKPALLPTLVAGVYWSIKQISGVLGANDGNGWNLLENTEQTIRTALIVINLIPLLAALLVTARFVERYAATSFARMYVFLTAAAGTLLLPFQVTLNNHSTAAVSVLFALYPAARILIDGQRRPGYFLCCGFFSAFACANEMPAAAFAAALGVALLVKDFRATLRFFLPASLVPVAAFMITTYASTGGYKPFYAYYGTEKYEYVIDGVKSYWMRPRGIDSNRDNPLVYFLHCTIGHHGIVSLSPVFLLTIASWLMLRRFRGHSLRLLLWIGLGLTAVVFGFYLSRTANYNYGGLNVGLRWLLWLIPLWLVGMIPVLDAFGSRGWFRATSALLLFMSVFSASYGLDNPWKHPWLFTWMEDRGWIDYRDRPQPFERPLTTWLARLPDEDHSGPYWVELSGPAPNGGHTRLRVEAVRETIDDTALVRLTATWDPDSDRARRTVIFVDPVSFEAGLPPEECLRWPDNPVDSDRRQEAVRFFRGLPESRAYQPGLTSYVRTALRTDAFECQHAASRVLSAPPGGDERLWYRTDLDLTPEIPFGVARVINTVYTSQGDSMLSRRQLTVDRASGF